MIREEDLEEASRLFKALSNPARLRIIRILSDTKRPLHIKAVSRELKLDYATVYRHIETLRKAKVIEVYEVGRSRVLSISKPRELKGLLESVKSFYKLGEEKAS